MNSLTNSSTHRLTHMSDHGSTATKAHFGRALASMAMIALFVVGCATTPQSPPGAADVRAKLTQLQSRPGQPRSKSGKPRRPFDWRKRRFRKTRN